MRTALAAADEPPPTRWWNAHLRYWQGACPSRSCGWWVQDADEELVERLQAEHACTPTTRQHFVPVTRAANLTITGAAFGTTTSGSSGVHLSFRLGPA